MSVTCLHAVLFLRYGKFMLEPMMHAQSLLMMVLSSDSVNASWTEYLSWLHVFKFDLGLLSGLYMKGPLPCTRSSSRLAKAELYCQETLLNYCNLCAMLAVCLVLRYLFKKAGLGRFCSQHTPHDAFWILWHILMPFAAISLWFEMWTFSDHLLCSFAAVMFMVAIVMY